MSDRRMSNTPQQQQQPHQYVSSMNELNPANPDLQAERRQTSTAGPPPCSKLLTPRMGKKWIRELQYTYLYNQQQPTNQHYYLYAHARRTKQNMLLTADA